MPINISLRQLNCFYIAYKYSNFSKAADHMGISQPALSQAIREMEAEIGHALFDRTTRRVRLTETGRQFLATAERAINAFDQARDELSNLAAGKAGQVTISCLPSVGIGLLPRLLPGFQAANPGITVEIMEEKLDAVMQRVRSGGADFGLSNTLDLDPDLQAEPLLSDSYALICRHDHPLAQRSYVKWSELAADNTVLVAMARDSGIWREMEAALHESGFVPRVTYRASSPATVLAIVATGIGVSPLPGLAWPGMGHPHLVHRMLIEPLVQRRISLLRRRGVLPTPAAKLFLDHILNNLKDGDRLPLL